MVKQDRAGRTARRGVTAMAVAASLAFTMAACGDEDEPTVAGGGQAVTTSTTAAPATTTTAPAVTVTATSNAALGTTILVDAAGKTLYVWDRDTGPASTCTGTCAVTWPPLVLPAGTTTPVPGSGVTDLTVAPRPDDPTKLQVNFGGKPLYYYAADTAAGETKGDGVGGTWHVAKPA